MCILFDTLSKTIALNSLCERLIRTPLSTTLYLNKRGRSVPGGQADFVFGDGLDVCEVSMSVGDISLQ